MSEATRDACLELTIDSATRKFTLEPGASCHIGRDAQNAIVLADNQVSRRHAVVERVATGECHLIDLGSRNGTFLNRRRVTAMAVLRSGDRIQIGGSELLFRGPVAGAAPAAVPQSETVVEVNQRLITVLVTDIRNFTGLSSRLAEAQLSEVVGAFVRESGAILDARGAWAHKFIGDAVMAFWLHPGDAPNLRDLHAVFTSLAGIFEVAAGLSSRFDLDAPVRIGAGINTGLASVGNLGSEASSDYTALSEAVNLAFRLESATKEIGCDLAVGRRTYEFLAARAPVTALFTPHTVKLKGYPDPRPVHAAMRDSLEILIDGLWCAMSQETTQTPVAPPAGEAGR